MSWRTSTRWCRSRREMLHVSIRGVGFQVIEKAHPGDILRQEVERAAQAAAKVIARFRADRGRDRPGERVPRRAGPGSGRRRGPCRSCARRLAAIVDDAFGLTDAQYLPHSDDRHVPFGRDAPRLRERLPALRDRPPVRVWRSTASSWRAGGSPASSRRICRSATRCVTYRLRGVNSAIPLRRVPTQFPDGVSPAGLYALSAHMGSLGASAQNAACGLRCKRTCREPGGRRHAEARGRSAGGAGRGRDLDVRGIRRARRHPRPRTLPGEHEQHRACRARSSCTSAAIRPLYRAQAQVELDAPLLVRRDEIIFSNFEGPHFTRGSVRPPQVDVPALLMAPPFQIQGSVALAPDADPTAALRALVQGFFVVREALVFDADGNALGEGEQIIVNGTAVQMTSRHARKHHAGERDHQRAEARGRGHESRRRRAERGAGSDARGIAAARYPSGCGQGGADAGKRPLFSCPAEPRTGDLEPRTGNAVACPTWRTLFASGVGQRQDGSRRSSMRSRRAPGIEPGRRASTGSRR